MWLLVFLTAWSLASKRERETQWNKAENTLHCYVLALNVTCCHTLLVEVILIQFLEVFFFDILFII